MKFSIITVSFNAKDSIRDTIISVVNQTWKDVEYIVIDGNSTDGTQKIICEYLSDIHQFISEPDKGMYDAMNKGIRLATGEIIGFLHADDCYANNFVLEKVAAKFANPQIDCVYGDLVYVKKEDTSKVIRYWLSGEYNIQNLKFGWMPPHPTFFVRKEIYRKYGEFNTLLKIAADYDLMMRFLGKHKLRCAYVPNVLVKMRLGGASNKSIRNILLKMKDDLWALRENEIGGFYTLIFKNLRKIKQLFRKN